MKVLIIIPAYNEAENIEKTVNDVIQNTDYDYVVVNDCSKDNTKEVCEKNNFNMLSLPINYGLTSGIQIGMKYAYKNNYDIAIQFDGDGQHQAKYLKNLVKEIEDGMKRRDCFLLTILLLTTVNLKISTLCNIGQFYYLCDFDRRALL